MLRVNGLDGCESADCLACNAERDSYSSTIEAVRVAELPAARVVGAARWRAWWRKGPTFKLALLMVGSPYMLVACAIVIVGHLFGFCSAAQLRNGLAWFWSWLS